MKSTDSTFPLSRWQWLQNVFHFIPSNEESKMTNDQPQRTPSGLVFGLPNEHGEEFVFFDDLKADLNALGRMGRKFLKMLANRPLGHAVSRREMENQLWDGEQVSSSTRAQLARKLRMWLRESDLSQLLDFPRGSACGEYRLVKRKEQAA